VLHIEIYKLVKMIKNHGKDIDWSNRYVLIGKYVVGFETILEFDEIYVLIVVLKVNT